MKCELLLPLLKTAVAISCGRASSAGRDVSVNISAFTQTQSSAPWTKGRVFFFFFTPPWWGASSREMHKICNHLFRGAGGPCTLAEICLNYAIAWFNETCWGRFISSKGTRIRAIQKKMYAKKSRNVKQLGCACHTGLSFILLLTDRRSKYWQQTYPQRQTGKDVIWSWYAHRKHIKVLLIRINASRHKILVITLAKDLFDLSAPDIDVVRRSPLTSSVRVPVEEMQTESAVKVFCR